MPHLAHSLAGGWRAALGAVALAATAWTGAAHAADAYPSKPITLVIPFLEVLPMVTSVFAGAISLFAIGLLARDGLFTLLGYVQVAISGTLVWWLLTSTTS